MKSLKDFEMFKIDFNLKSIKGGLVNGTSCCEIEMNATEYMPNGAGGAGDLKSDNQIVNYDDDGNETGWCFTSNPGCGC